MPHRMHLCGWSLGDEVGYRCGLGLVGGVATLPDFSSSGGARISWSRPSSHRSMIIGVIYQYSAQIDPRATLRSRGEPHGARRAM
jgi:hypothetical protein